jgi:hypothetical protein
MVVVHGLAEQEHGMSKELPQCLRLCSRGALDG